MRKVNRATKRIQKGESIASEVLKEPKVELVGSAPLIFNYGP